MIEMNKLKLRWGETLREHIDNQEGATYWVDLFDQEVDNVVTVISMGQLLWDRYLFREEGKDEDLREPGVYKDDISTEDDTDFYTIVVEFKDVNFRAVEKRLEELNDRFGTDFELEERSEDTDNGEKAANQGCQCEDCVNLREEEGKVHLSDCSVHNEPALEKGECDCEPADV